MASRYVLDTHTCLFMLAAPRKLGKGARRALQRVERGAAEAFIPAVAAAEVVLLRSLGRTELGLVELRAVMDASPHLRFLPMDLAQVDEFAALAALRDPFDRLIVAAARAADACLITRDGPITQSGLIATVWD